MFKRSISPGLLLSAAVLFSGLASSSAFGQAPRDLKSLADDFLHYSRVNNTELAKANGEAILASGAKPEDVLKAFEAAAGGSGYRDVLVQVQRRTDLKDVADKLLSTVDNGYRAMARDPRRIREAVDRLGSGPRAYQNARDQLASAGEYAVPIFISALQDPTKQDLRSFVLRAMGEIGRPILNPLLEELRTSDPTLRIDLVKVMGSIGYPQVLPALRAIQNDERSSVELKSAAQAAIIRIDSTGLAGNMSPAELYLSGAKNYYEKKVSYQPMGTTEATNPVWYFDQGLNNVTPVQVPTVIWNDVMALRMAESSLRADESNTGAIALWNAANLRREIQLPKGEKDPTRSADAQDAAFYALAAGPRFMNPVLAMALDDKDIALSLRAIEVLEKTGGISGLVSTGDAPLVRALAHPDRGVRFHAAFALARANPVSQFPSFYRVVPVLAEAVNSNASPAALLVVNDDDMRNAVSEALRNSPQRFTVYAGKSASSAIEQAQKAPAIDVVIVPDGPDRATLANLSRSDYRLMGVPVLVTANASDLPRLRIELQKEKGVVVIDQRVTTDSMTEALAQARTEGGMVALSGEDAAKYATESLELLAMLAADHKSIYSVMEAVPTLIDALKDKRPEVVAGAARVLGELNSPEGQQALAASALSNNEGSETRVMFFNQLRESAKRTGNTLDAAAINGIIRLVSSEPDVKLRTAAAGALGALNVSSNQASSLILRQAK